MKRVVFLLLVILLAAGFTELDAQCPMCRMSAESNLKDGGTAGLGLNAGILYMLSMPYILVAVFGYIWYRNRKTEADDEKYKWN